MQRASSRTGLVIGGSSGLGAASALMLTRRGYKHLYLVYFSDDAKAAATRESVAQAGAAVTLIKADVATAAGVHEIVTELSARKVALTALVYAAGYRALASPLELEDVTWRRMVDVTLTGFVRTVQLTERFLIDGGKVVLISGLSGIRVYSPEHLMMGTAKAAAHHATQYLAWELAGRSINVNAVCCGFVATEGVMRDLPAERYKLLINRARDNSPLKRVASTEEVARVVAFLCSDDAAMLVGQVLVADGGETLR